jgi:hypothetical protein
VLRGGERNSQNTYFENQIWSMDRKQCRGGDALREPTLIDSILVESVLVHSADLLPTHASVSQQFYFQHTLRLYISHGTDTILTRYDTGRTEIPFGPFDVCIWVSPVLVRDSSIEDTLHQCPFRGIFAESLN